MDQHHPLAAMSLIVVGSMNPVKRAAVAAVLARTAPWLTVEAVAASSGVSDQPWGDSETQAGARARAIASLDGRPLASLAFGVEGGVVREPDGSVRTCAWVVARDRTGREGMGGSLAMPLPPGVVRLLEAGVELGHAMDQVARTSGTKHGRGAVGLLTRGLLDRQQAYEPLVAYALAPWLGAQFWEP
jgi:inosine/xanthosine triphosphatase